MRQKTSKKQRKRNQAVRRRRIRESGGRHSPTQWLGLVEAQGWLCKICNQKMVPPVKTHLRIPIPPNMLTKDHTVPLVFGGSHGISNIQALCSRCHMAKTSEESQRVEYLRGTDIVARFRRKMAQRESVYASGVPKDLWDWITRTVRGI